MNLKGQRGCNRGLTARGGGAFAVAIAVAVLSFPALAQEVSLVAGLDRNEVRLGDRVALTFSVEGSQEAGAPELPPLADFDVAPAGRSTNMQIVNGRMSVAVTHRFILTPKRAGIFTIGPASVKVGGSRYSSKQLTVKVLPAEARASEPESPRDLFLTTQVSRRDPFLNQQLIYTLRFYHRVRFYNGNLEFPDFDGFNTEQLGKQKDYDTTIKGERYRVTEVRLALFPLQPGPLTIPAARLNCEVQVRDPRRDRRRRRRPFDDFFEGPFDDLFHHRRVERRTVSSQAIDMTVRALPPSPPGYSGLVGQFELSGDVSKSQLGVGESTTLTLTVRGAGNAGFIPEPEVRGLEGFKVYADKPVGKVKTTRKGVSGYKTFKKALVPLREGEAVIPQPRLTYFDPELGEYRVIRAGPFRLEVTPATGEEELKLTELLGPPGGKQAVKLLGQDLLPLHRGLEGLAPHGLGPTSIALGGGGLILPPLLFLGLVLGLRRRERLERDVALRRRLGAMASARARLRTLRAELRAGDRRQREAVEAASRALREFLGDMLNLEGGALTAAEAGARLRDAGLSAERAAEVQRSLGELEAALYGAGRSEAVDERRLARLIRTLDRELRKVLRR